MGPEGRRGGESRTRTEEMALLCSALGTGPLDQGIAPQAALSATPWPPYQQTAIGVPPWLRGPGHWGPGWGLPVLQVVIHFPLGGTPRNVQGLA